jgi:mono/diheme cytochrome c family protein
MQATKRLAPPKLSLRIWGLFAAIGGLVASVAVGAQQSAAPAGDVTFTKDVAPILQRHCQTCHRPDSLAPMSLLTYEEARPYARAIKTRTALRTQRGAMPPWYIEKDIGIQQYKDDPSLSEEEIAKLAKWADSGAPRGNPADMPPPLNFDNGGQWKIGKPDLIVSSPDVTVEAMSADQWVSLGTVPTGLTEDRYVSAVEVREVNDIPKNVDGKTVGGRFVFHHMNYSSSTDPSGRIDETSTHWPLPEVGRNGDIFPDNAGKLLQAGSVLVLEQAHLHANGRDTKARLEFAFKFHPKDYKPGVKWVNVSGLGKGADLDVKPLMANQELHAYAVLQQHTKVVTFEPHLHAAGTRMCLEAIWGTDIQTLTCAGYDHNWVRTYAYSDDAMPLLPKGTILHIIGVLDTSAANKNVLDGRNWSGGGRRSVANMFHNTLGTYIELSEEQFEREMAERVKKLNLTKNDYVIGCPLCMGVSLSPAATTASR